MALNHNFTDLELPDSPNWYLSCPKDMCEHGQRQSPIYPISKIALRNIVMKAIEDMPRTKLLEKSEQGIRFVQRTLVLRFPDFVDIGFFQIDENHSSLAIYSRSKYGHYDFNVNKKRVESLIQEIERLGQFGPND